jgi:pimeloyl-ACP methyl ester carboxylesterase
VVLVAQSLGGFTAPLVAAKVPLGSLIFVNAMIPAPGETPGQWWDNTGWARARVAAAEKGGYGTELDLAAYFLHDVPPEIAVAGEPHQRPEADIVFESACDFSEWPSIPIRVAAGADDRFFPAGFQQELARQRLGIETDILPGGHLIALSSQPGSPATCSAPDDLRRSARRTEISAPLPTTAEARMEDLPPLPPLILDTPRRRSP